MKHLICKAGSGISSISLQLPSPGISLFWWLRSLFRLNTAHQQSLGRNPQWKCPSTPLPMCIFQFRWHQWGQDGIKQIFGHARAVSHPHCVTQDICDLPFPIPVPHWALSLAEHRSRAVLALPQLCKFPSIRNLRVSGGFSELLQHHQAVALEHQS